MNSDFPLNSLSRESTLEDSYYLDQITGQPVLKPANKPPDYLHSPISLHPDSQQHQSNTIYSPSSPHPTSTVKTTGRLVSIRSPRRQQPQVPRRRSLERQVRLEEEDKFDQFNTMSAQQQQQQQQQQTHLTANKDLLDEHGNRKDSYESYTTSLGDEEDRDLEFYEDTMQTAWYPKDQQWNNQWVNQQQQQKTGANRALPQQPTKANNLYDQQYNQQQEQFPQNQQQQLQPQQQRPFYDQQYQLKETDQQQYIDTMNLGPNEMQLNNQQLAPNKQQQKQQQQQLISPQIQKQQIGTDLITDPQSLDQFNNNKKEQWRQNKNNKNETTVWQTVSEDETYDDSYMEQHLQQQKQKQPFGVVQPIIEEQPYIPYDQQQAANKQQQTIADQSLDLMNQNKTNDELNSNLDMNQQQLMDQTKVDQFDKREQWKSLPDQQSSLWQTAESEDQFDLANTTSTSKEQQQDQQDSTLSMLGGIQQPTDKFDNYDHETIVYDEQAENEKLFDQFDVNKQKAIGQPPSALRNQNLTGFSEPKTVTFSDQIQEESYEVISEGSTVKNDQKQIRTDPYTGQQILDSELSYLDDLQNGQMNKMQDLTIPELDEQQPTDDFYGMEEPLNKFDNDEGRFDDQLIGSRENANQDRSLQSMDDSMLDNLPEHQSSLIQFAPENSESKSFSIAYLRIFLKY